MNRMRSAGSASSLCVAFGLTLAAGPVHAQSPAPDDVGRALRSLQLGLVELPEITPEILGLQRELVEALHLKLAAVKAESDLGSRLVEDVLDAELAYRSELETLKVMEARTANSQVSQDELLQIRIGIRSDMLNRLKQMADLAQSRHRAGEVMRTEVEGAKARVLKAEIMLETLKNAARRGNSTAKLQ